MYFFEGKVDDQYVGNNEVMLRNLSSQSKRERKIIDGSKEEKNCFDR